MHASRLLRAWQYIPITTSTQKTLQSYNIISNNKQKIQQKTKKTARIGAV